VARLMFSDATDPPVPPALPPGLPDAPAAPTVTATVVGKPFVLRGRKYSFRVRFAVPHGFDLSALRQGDSIQVTGPGGTVHAVDFVRLRRVRRTGSVLALYRMPAPGGTFDAGDSG